ncbi:MAG: helix-turn-helix domain-containing protein [Micromonosporaceae bacterium]|nr:helix-turn-helix domain-containing protein [Micromonosporaceae bacterium]
MPKVTGPTIPRWQLGEELARRREAAGVSTAEVAEKLDCSESKIKKIEAGYVGVVKAELAVMLDLYQVEDQQDRDSLLGLQKLGKQRGWWSQFGRVPNSFGNFLGLESSATSIRIFEPLVAHGLLQTEEYATAHERTVSPGLSPEQVERQVKIRMARQERVLRGEEPPEAWVVLDEAVLRRVVGGVEVMRRQLEHLRSMVDQVTLQVVPFSHGGYPGMLGAFTIFEFNEDIRSPVAYVEGQGGGLYLEKAPDLQRCNVSYNHLTAAALSPPQSAKLIAAVLRDMKAD